MGVTFDVVDLTPTSSPLAAGPTVGKVDLDDLRNQLETIRDGIAPVLEGDAASSGIRLQKVEIDLTVGLEGHVWFIAKGKGEASLKLEFSRSSS